MSDPDLDEVLALLRDPMRFMRWHQDVGQAEAERILEQAARDVMRRDGVTAIVGFAERLDNLTARLEEWTR